MPNNNPPSKKGYPHPDGSWIGEHQAHTASGKQRNIRIVVKHRKEIDYDKLAKVLLEVAKQNMLKDKK